MATKKLQILDTSLGSNIYTQPDEPANAPDGALWVDTDAEAQSNSVRIDASLTIEGQAADAAVVGNRLSALSEEIANLPGGGGLSQNAKSLLITILRNATYEIDQTANITALETALSGSTEPEQPESGIVQSGSVLAITSGVTAIQTGSMLAVA